MLHQLWLQDFDVYFTTKITVLQNRTNFILSQLGFSWSHITSKMLTNVISQSLEK